MENTHAMANDMHPGVQPLSDMATHTSPEASGARPAAVPAQNEEEPWQGREAWQLQAKMDGRSLVHESECGRKESNMARTQEHEDVQSPKADKPSAKQDAEEAAKDSSSAEALPLTTTEHVDSGVTDVDEGGISPDHAQDEDGFSDYESDRSSFYSSLLSEATDYYWENGRRYHAHRGGQYMLPNDEMELDREDMKHHEWMLVTQNRLHLSPISESPQKILDIGTGTGIWAMQIADRYPSAEVIGTDISPVQPRWVPANLQFEVDDLEKEWLFRPNTFDLINIRFDFLAIKDWPSAIAQAYKTLAPGAYLELTDLNLRPVTFNSEGRQATTVAQWIGTLEIAMARQGFEMCIASKFKQMLINAGFVDVVETKFDVPWGTWPKNKRQKVIGYWHVEQLKQGLQGIAMGLLTRVLGWSSSEVEVFLAELRKELDDNSLMIKDTATVAYGRKPFSHETQFRGT